MVRCCQHPFIFHHWLGVWYEHFELCSTCAFKAIRAVYYEKGVNFQGHAFFYIFFFMQVMRLCICWLFVHFLMTEMCWLGRLFTFDDRDVLTGTREMQFCNSAMWLLTSLPSFGMNSSPDQWPICFQLQQSSHIWSVCSFFFLSLASACMQCMVGLPKTKYKTSSQ